MTQHRSQTSSLRRRRRSRPTRAPLVGSLVAMVCLGAALAIVGGPADRATTSDRAQRDPGARLHVDVRPGGRAAVSGVYRYSVVAGGIHSVAQLRESVLEDPVVAAHYADIAVSRARMTRLAAPRRAYVSYRMHDRIYWTKHQVALQAGEAVLTDGVSEIRARCGNRISGRPMEPTSSAEPDVVEFDQVVPLAPTGADPGLESAEFDGAFAPDHDVDASGSAASVGPGGATRSAEPSSRDSSIGVGGPLGLRRPGGVPTGRSLDPPSGNHPLSPVLPGDPPGDPPPSVPEPVSVLLVGTGLTAYAMWGRRRR